MPIPPNDDDDGGGNDDDNTTNNNDDDQVKPPFTIEVCTPGEVCREPRYSCEQEAVCTEDGKCPYPKPIPARDRVECRPAAGPCDEPEYCMGWSLSCGPDSYARKGAACEDANGEVSTCPGGKPNRKARDPLYGSKRDHRKKDNKKDKDSDKKKGRRLAEETEAGAAPRPATRRVANPFTGTTRRSSVSSDGTVVILSSSAKSSSYPSLGGGRLGGGPKHKKNPTVCPLAADDDDDRKKGKKDKQQRDNKKADKDKAKGRRRL